MLFTPDFQQNLKSLIGAHHSLYPELPPQGIFFESLVRRAFTASGWKDVEVVASTPNSPQHDLLVGKVRISLKTETGSGTDPGLISITKLCTTEREPWDSATLIRHALDHLSRYDHILMLRAIRRKQGVIQYQLLEVPIPLLALMKNMTAEPVGRRSGRRSLGADVYDEGERVFHVHFDGADGKCQIRRLLLSRCRMLLGWEHTISE